MSKFFLSLLLLTPINFLFAAEGLWEPSQLPNIEKDIRAAGLKGNSKKFSNLFGQP